MSYARSLGAQNLHGFSSINGYAATVTTTQASQLAADASVAAVYPDLPIPESSSPVLPAAGTAATSPSGSTRESASGGSAVGPVVCPSDPAHPLLEPEALQVTNTAFSDHSTPQAQNIVDGNGMKVAFIADGLDVNNPDFIRADGSHVFVDYEDFTGNGLGAVSAGAEAFGDASSIAAQGLHAYDLSKFVSPPHALPGGCDITIRGVAPGASLIGLRVFDANVASAPTSRFVQAIDYAVASGVDVLNESFGGNPYPDNGNDPLTLADQAAVAAGVTVVASTGDAGASGTVEAPGSSPAVISVGASTTFRSYFQSGFSGAQLSNHTWTDNNVSGLSSGGITQHARVPDLIAPGDMGWAVCTPDLTRYTQCIDEEGNPSPVEVFGGTSAAAPMVAGAAALIIEAYEKTHHGVRPAPALVKRLLTSTATDEGHPAYEQGAGLLNSLAAVQAAESWTDSNGSPAAQGSNLVVDRTQASVIGQPGSRHMTKVSVTNVSKSPKVVSASTRTLSRVVSSISGSTTLNTATAPTYPDLFFAAPRSYVAQSFNVPAHADRLIASASAAANGALRVILIDPHGAYTAYSFPQGPVTRFASVEVRYPIPGKWIAYFALPKGSGFDGPVLYNFTTADYQPAGVVVPPVRVIPAGGTASFTVVNRLPKQPGDESTSAQFAAANVPTLSVPVTLRSMVPAGNTSFIEQVTGGNGRSSSPAQANTYYLQVPPGKRDLSIGVTFADPNQTVFGILTTPDGQVASYQANTTPDASATEGGLQMYARHPRPGTWTLSLVVANPASGLELSQTFTVRVAYNTVSVQAALPHHANLAAGVPVTVPVTVTNTGAVPMAYFADGRLASTGTIQLTELSGNATSPLPLPDGVFPFWLVPTETTELDAHAAADQPVNMELNYNSGEPDLYSAGTGDTAAVNVTAPQVSPGIWLTYLGENGPFPGPAPAGTVTVSASAIGRQFDPNLTSTTGDFWQNGVDPATHTAQAASLRARAAMLARTAPAEIASSSSSPADPAADTGPLILKPGQAGNITITLTPPETPGTQVHGTLYIDTLNNYTDAGDELIALPYTYKTK
jgi:hypothetical protein